jgi:hypothetical protein
MVKVLIKELASEGELKRMWYYMHKKLIPICSFVALKVHISSEFQAILMILGGYNVVERGETLLKVW